MINNTNRFLLHKSSLIVLFIVILFLISACFNEWHTDKGTIIINFSDNSRNALPWPPDEEGILDQLNYEILLTSAGKRDSFPAGGAKTITRTVESGHWDISIKAYYNGMYYAAGSGSKFVLAGQSNPVTITMRQILIDQIVNGTWTAIVISGGWHEPDRHEPCNAFPQCLGYTNCNDCIVVPGNSGVFEDALELTLDNGSFEQLNDNIELHRGIYSANDGVITMISTEFFGYYFDLERKWYSRNELEKALKDLPPNQDGEKWEDEQIELTMELIFSPMEGIYSEHVLKLPAIFWGDEEELVEYSRK